MSLTSPRGSVLGSAVLLSTSGASPVGSVDPILLVDANNCLLRSFFAYPDLCAPDGVPTGALYGVVNRIREAVEKFQPSRVVACWDGGRAAWRRHVFSGYKDRPRSESSPDLSPCFAQWAPLRALLTAMGVDQIKVEGVEADDLIAWFSLVPEAVCGDVVILSTDRDFYQLVTDGAAATSVYYGITPKKGGVEHVTLETFRNATISATLPSGAEDPGEWAAYRVVNGDASDKIPGVRGLSGEKRWSSVYGTLCAMGYEGDGLDYFIGRDEVGVAGSFGAVVAENWELLQRNTILMSLPFAVGMLEQQRIDPAKHVEAGAWDERAFKHAIARYAFQSALSRWGEWRDTFRGLAERRMPWGVVSFGWLRCS